MKKSSVGDMWRVGSEMTRLGMEANAVIWMRMMGMAGLWNVSASEDERMLAEKPEAFRDAGMRAGLAAMGGAAPDKIVSAAIKPLTRKAAANRRRLAKRGPAK